VGQLMNLVLREWLALHEHEVLPPRPGEPDM
jgi:hypothetical protein